MTKTLEYQDWEFVPVGKKLTLSPQRGNHDYPPHLSIINHLLKAKEDFVDLRINSREEGEVDRFLTKYVEESGGFQYKDGQKANYHAMMVESGWWLFKRKNIIAKISNQAGNHLYQLRGYKTLFGTKKVPS